MTSRARGLLSALAAFAAGFAVWVGFWVGVFYAANATGFNKQITPQYGFTSGVGPMVLAAIGYSTLFAGVWHGLNCHVSGCWAFGRHRVNGTPYCNAHHETARDDITDSARLDRIIELLEGMQDKR